MLLIKLQFYAESFSIIPQMTDHTIDRNDFFFILEHSGRCTLITLQFDWATPGHNVALRYFRGQPWSKQALEFISIALVLWSSL